MALKYAPLLINTFVSGGGSGGGLADLAASFLGGSGAGAAAAKPAVDTKVTAVTPNKNDKIGAGVAVSVSFQTKAGCFMGAKSTGLTPTGQRLTSL